MNAIEQMDPGAVLDQIIAAAAAKSREPGITQESSTTRKALPLMQKPLPIADDTPRDIAQIDPKLRECIRGLVTGQLDWPLFLTGGPGRGKSAAVLCLCDHCFGSVYYRFSRFLKAFEYARSESGIPVLTWKSERDYSQRYNVNLPSPPERWIRGTSRLNEGAFWEYLATASLVVIDDVATRGGYTEPQYDLFCDLLEARKRKPMVVVSNHDLLKLAEVFDERVTSRLAAGTRFVLQGSDRRIEGKKR